MDENFQNMNRLKEIYDDETNNNSNQNPLIYQIKNGEYNSQNDDIYSSMQSNTIPKINQINGDKNNANFNTMPINNDRYDNQFKEDYFVPPPINIPKPLKDLKTEYTPKTNNDNNQGCNAEITNQTNVNFSAIKNKYASISPLQISSEPLISSNSPLDKYPKTENCCTKKDDTLKHISDCQIFWLILYSFYIVSAGILELIFCPKKDEINTILVFSTNIVIFIFVIFMFFTILSIRWLRISGTILSILIVVGSFTTFVVCLVRLENEDAKDISEIYVGIKLLKIVLLGVFLNFILDVYWGIKLFNKSNR